MQMTMEMNMDNKMEMNTVNSNDNGNGNKDENKSTDINTFWQALSRGDLIKMIKDSAPGQKVSNSGMAFHVLRPFFTTEKERMMCIFLNAQNQIIKIETLCEGSITSSFIYPRELIKKILKHNAVAIILAHNHPSGDSKPSREDIAITKKIIHSCIAIDVVLHEHIVCGNTDYYSMADENILSEHTTQVKKFLKTIV